MPCARIHEPKHSLTLACFSTITNRPLCAFCFTEHQRRKPLKTHVLVTLQCKASVARECIVVRDVLPSGQAVAAGNEIEESEGTETEDDDEGGLSEGKAGAIAAPSAAGAAGPQKRKRGRPRKSDTRSPALV